MAEPTEKIEHVYIVDDDEVDQYLVKRCIKHLLPEAPIRAFSSAEIFLAFVDESIQQGDENPFKHSLITLDLNMPGMGGMGALKEIQERQESKKLSEDKINCYVLTSSNSAHDKADISAFNFVNQYITKPLTPDLLKGIIENFS